MNRFSSEFVHIYAELDFKAVESILDRAEAARLSVNRVTDVSPVAKIPHKARDLFQIGLRRNIELSLGFIHTFNAGLFIPLFVLSRASIETACLVWDAWRQLDQIMTSRDKGALDTYDDFLAHAILGGKSNTWSILAERYPARNVLTIINHLMGAGYSGLRECYDLLCEYAHPNYHGMYGVYSVIDEMAYETRYVDRPMEAERRGTEGNGVKSSLFIIRWDQPSVIPVTPYSIEREISKASLEFPTPLWGNRSRKEAVQGRRRGARTRRWSSIPTRSRPLPTFSGGGS